MERQLFAFPPMPNILGSTRKLHDHEEQLPVFPVPETDSITIPDDWLNNNIEKFEVWIAGHRAKSYTLTNISVDDLRKFFFICRSQRKNIYGEGGAERCSSPGTEFGDLVHVHPSTVRTRMIVRGMYVLRRRCCSKVYIHNHIIIL